VWCGVVLVSAGAVLDREGEGMAVRLALGETFLLAENRQFFETEGVDLGALEGAKGGKGPKQRSKTTILVKNLPYTTSQVRGAAS
jgi:multiple RNA-binding domain-containing protein 1